jgi:hypothetical protein
MRSTLRAVTLAAAFIVLSSGASTAAIASSAPDSGDQQPTAPVAIVESFLLARSMGDFWEAAGWCASLLELQDSDGSWFVDAPSTREWLRQLASRYVVDTMTHPAVEGNTVAWTERLARRGIPFPEALRASIGVQVHAVVRDGKIAYLSGPYPPIPFRNPGLTSGEPDLRERSTSGLAVPPFTLFVASALGLALAALLANLLGPTIQRRCGRSRSASAGAWWPAGARSRDLPLPTHEAAERNG